MAVNYVVKQRFNPNDPEAPKKWYGIAKSTGNSTLRKISKKIESISTVSSIDTMAVLEAFLQVLPEELGEGRTVRLGDFGSFRITIMTEGVEEEKNFSSKNILRNKMVFTPGKEVKNALSFFEYRKEDQKIEL
ncbi:MAG: HU family DNA-binding protein [Candidatus Cloacimonetes bacterium]|nr:HU family DNA-binding protein [Candidatus Cloacimonadota bacterium]